MSLRVGSCNVFVFLCAWSLRTATCFCLAQWRPFAVRSGAASHVDDSSGVLLEKCRRKSSQLRQVTSKQSHARADIIVVRSISRSTPSFSFCDGWLFVRCNDDTDVPEGLYSVYEAIVWQVVHHICNLVCSRRGNLQLYRNTYRTSSMCKKKAAALWCVPSPTRTTCDTTAS